MKLKTTLTVAVLASASLLAAGTAQARPEEKGHGPVVVHREPAPKFVAHAQGVHPRGATVHSHPIRVLKPAIVVHGGRGAFHHWEHPAFERPLYYWDWNVIRSVTCVAEDSYGDQYPVTESWGRGYGLDNMSNVEDDALDRCHDESGNDDTCYLATCTHY